MVAKMVRVRWWRSSRRRNLRSVVAWRRLAAKINADKAANGVAVVERIFHALIGEPKALLRDIHPQHALQSNGWPPAPTTFGIKRLQLSKQGRPGQIGRASCREKG